jgi:hypothetical protein
MDLVCKKSILRTKGMERSDKPYSGFFRKKEPLNLLLENVGIKTIGKLKISFFSFR